MVGLELEGHFGPLPDEQAKDRVALSERLDGGWLAPALISGGPDGCPEACEFQLDVWSTKALLLGAQNRCEPGGGMSSRLSRGEGDGPSCLPPASSALFCPQGSWT